MHSLLIVYYIVGIISVIVCTLDYLLNGDDIINSIFIIPGLLLIGPFLWPFMFPLLKVFILELKDEYKWHGICTIFRYFTKINTHLRILKRRLIYLEQQGNTSGSILLTKWWDKSKGSPLLAEDSIRELGYLLMMKGYGFYIEKNYIYFMSKQQLAHMLTSPDIEIRELALKYKTRPKI